MISLLRQAWYEPTAGGKPGDDRYFYAIKQWPKTCNATATLLPRDMVPLSAYQLGTRIRTGLQKGNKSMAWSLRGNQNFIKLMTKQETCFVISLITNDKTLVMK